MRSLVLRGALPAFVICAALHSAPASAQATKSTSQTAFAQSTIQDIIVTANKRSESINRVGLSITAVSGSDLTAAGITNPAELGKVVPGFYYTKSLYGTPVYTMRGVGFNNTALGLSPAVSVYVDEVPLSYPAMTIGATLDVERVEAIKGPQGVLFGNNSTGGAINYIAAKPTANFHTGGSVSLARFGRFDSEAYVSGPLSDTLRARVSLRSEQGGAWQVSQTRPSDHRGSADRLFGRALLQWRPDSRLDMLLSVNGWRDNSETPARRALGVTPLLPGTIIGLPVNFFEPAGLIAALQPPTSGSRAADWDADQSFRNHSRFFEASLRSSYQLGGNAKLTAISAFSKITPHSAIDEDGLAYNSSTLIQDGSIRNLFQEIRLDAQLDDRLSILVGANYEHARIHDSLTADSNTSIAAFFLGNPRTTSETKVDTQRSTYAAFGKLDYQLTPQFKLTAALRYSADRQSSGTCSYDRNGGIAALQNAFNGTSFVQGDCVTFLPAVVGQPRVAGVVRGKLNEHNLSWRFGAEWQPTSRLLFYATANRGFKAGGFPTVFAFDAVQLTPVVQEQLDAYELGGKLSLIDRHVQLNAAVFRYDYKNKQIQGRVIVPPLGPLENIVNIPKSRVNGAEVDLTVRPVDGLSLHVGSAYVDSRIAAGTFAYTPFGIFASVGGEAFPSTPKWQVNADTTYEFPVNAQLRGLINGSVAYLGKTNGAFGNLPVLNIPGYTLADARVGIGARDRRWTASLFVRNLTDKTYFTTTQQTIEVLTRYYGMPRTFGAMLQFSF